MSQCGDFNISSIRCRAVHSKKMCKLNERLFSKQTAYTASFVNGLFYCRSYPGVSLLVRAYPKHSIKLLSSEWTLN